MTALQQKYDITAMGGRLYPFINAIRRSDVVCTHQHCRGEVFYCRIHGRYLEKVQELAKKQGVTLTCTPRPSLSCRLRRYRWRLGIPLGVLLCAGILFYFSNTAAVIEIRGNSVVSESVIRSVLAQSGISEGVWIAGIDFPHSERALQLAVPEISWVGIRSNGNHLIVEISEASPQIPMLAERTPCNVVSSYDAQITDVRVYRGHLVRLIGDGVAEGELLVSGVFEDDKGHVNYHHAIAEITGIYQKEAELSEYHNVSRTSPTGSTHVRRFFRLLSLKIPLGSGNHGFSEYREQVTDTPLCFLGQVLPFGVVQQTFTETETTVSTRNPEETQLALNGAIVRYEKNFLEDVKILQRDIAYSADENGMSAHLVYTVEGEIGRVSDIYIK